MASRYVDSYCDLAQFEPDEALLLAHDGSECTMIVVDGMRSIESTEAATDAFVEFLGADISASLKLPGHRISVSFESSQNIGQETARIFGEMGRAAQQKQIDVTALTEEAQQIAETHAIYIKVLIACWTTPGIASKTELAEARGEAARLRRDTMPPAINAQDPFLRLEPLDGAHNVFVGRVLTGLDNAGIQARVLAPTGRTRHDLVEIRRGLLFHETPSDWAPFGIGDRTYPGAKQRVDADLSEFFAPRISRQMMTAATSTDKSMRSIGLGGRAYAVSMIDLFPQAIYPFRDLFLSLRDGAEKNMPFRICFHFAGGKYGPGLMQIIAGFASLASPQTKNLFHANKKIIARTKRDTGEQYVSTRILACTWREPFEQPDVLERRRAYLTRSLTSWGNALVSDTPGNPMGALTETVAGLTCGARVAKQTFVPIIDSFRMLPFHITAPVFPSGQSIFLTLDNQLAPHAAFSQKQNFWLTLIYATMGSGKSVLLNRLNQEFVCYYPGREIPYLLAIDLGVSSSGFIKVVQMGLPADMRHLADYVRLMNDKSNALNQFDIGLGRRTPLPRERDYINQFLLKLISPPQDLRDSCIQLVSQMVKRLFQLKSDLEISTQPNTWEAGIDRRVDEACRAAGVRLQANKTRWYEIMDEMAARGDYVNAMRAQRHAVPRLVDCAPVLAHPSIIDDFDDRLVRFVRVAIETAIEAYPIFANTTVLDLGETRIAAIDLNDVAQLDETVAAKRNNALMFMAANNLFMQKIAGYDQEIKQMEFKPAFRDTYVAYWTRRYENIQETPKRLAMDEYHITGGDEEISAVVLSNARLGRKWGLEIILASQLLPDFQRLKKFASTVFILNAETKELREEAQELFGFSDAVRDDLREHVHGPQPGKGALFLARYMLNEQERWTILVNRIGPTLLWALTTKREDRLLRDELYKRMTGSEALRLLAKRYRAGTAVDHWNKVSTQTENDDGVAKTLADIVIAEYVSSAGREAAAVPRH